jgi:aminocarboxymuconate-semialdehyde decarboxylase
VAARHRWWGAGSTVGGSAATLELLRAHAHPANLMCGSDYPFDMGWRGHRTCRTAPASTTSPLERNARRFLGL